MAYVKIQTVDGQEFEHQVIDVNQNILVSEGHDRFQSLGDLYLRLEAEAEDQGRSRWEKDAEVINDYFDGQALVDIYFDRGYGVEDATDLLKLIINQLLVHNKSYELSKMKTFLNNTTTQIDNTLSLTKNS